MSNQELLLGHAGSTSGGESMPGDGQNVGQATCRHAHSRGAARADSSVDRERLILTVWFHCFPVDVFYSADTVNRGDFCLAFAEFCFVKLMVSPRSLGDESCRASRRRHQRGTLACFPLGCPIEQTVLGHADGSSGGEVVVPSDFGEQAMLTVSPKQEVLLGLAVVTVGNRRTGRTQFRQGRGEGDLFALLSRARALAVY